MLKQLTLKNFVLVDALDIDFSAGLTTITGESGAGKSILLNALGLLLGDRANTEAIRPGADKADVSAEFDLTGLAAATRLNDDELTGDEPGQCLIRRVVSKQGRSRAFINNVPVTTQYLRELGAELVDVHGQNEHLRLANRTTQLAMLDDFAKQQKSAAAVRAAFAEWQAALKTIESLRARVTAAKDRSELLSYQLQELTELDIQPGEFEQLEADQRRLANAQSTLEILHSAEDELAELDSVRHTSARIAGIRDDHASLKSAQSNLADALSLLDDAAHDLRHYREQVVVDPGALTEVDARMSAAISLARKHRVDPIALHAFASELSDELAGISADDSQLAQLQTDSEVLHEAYLKKAKALSKQRKKAAPAFCKQVGAYMRDLGIGQGQLDIKFDAAETEHGLDRIEFRVTTNPNFPAGSLAQIASGGEQTRIALSIQIVAAQNSALPCLILDEADVGVGGTTADTVGRILRDLGKHAQVICITHAPQVAALGNQHLRVVKQGDSTAIHQLDEPRRVDELARMLAGADITDKTLDYAATLLAEANG